MKYFDEGLVSIHMGTPDCLRNVDAIQVDSVVVMPERRMSPLELAGGEPVAKKLNKETEVPGLVVLDLDTDPHQWLRELAKRVASEPRPTDESGGLEFSDLLGGGLVRHQAGRRYALYGRGLAREAEELDDLALGRGKLTHPVLVVGRQVIDHVHKRTDEILERLLVEEVEQDHIGPMVAGGEMVDGSRTGAAERRAEEGREFHLALVDGLLGEQLDSGVKVDLLQRTDGEESVEGLPCRVRAANSDGVEATMVQLPSS